MASPWPFEIVFEDQHLIVLSKSAGLLSQSDDSGEKSLVDYLRTYFGRNYVGIVHRLDRNTSGLMVVAKRSKAANRLTESLKAGELVRHYQALVYGELPKEFRWRHFLIKDEAKNKVRSVPAGRAEAKEAILSGRLLKNYKPKGQHGHEFLSLGEFILETGRSHQIRVQASTEGFPLVGDAKYSEKNSIPLARPALHSCFLKFPHPMSNEIKEFKLGLPQDIEKILTSLSVI